MKFRLVADIYYGLFDGSACEIIKESDSLDEIEATFDSACDRYRRRFNKAEFASCHIIALCEDEDGNDAWASLPYETQERLAKSDISIE